MKLIALTKGYFAKVDDEDFEMVSGFKWQAKIGKTNVYAVRTVRAHDGFETTQSMHRLVMGVTDSKAHVDHINHNGIDNQKNNLRIATNAQNCRNRRTPKNNSSGYKGVSFNKKDGKFFARYADAYLGCFDCPMEAARHYNQAAKEHGEGFELLNQVEPMFPTVHHLTRQLRDFERVIATKERIEAYMDKLNKGGLPKKHKGVTFNRKSGNWMVKVNGKYVGSYMEHSEAVSAKDAAINKQNGYNERNHKDKLRS